MLSRKIILVLFWFKIIRYFDLSKEDSWQKQSVIKQVVIIEKEDRKNRLIING